MKLHNACDVNDEFFSKGTEGLYKYYYGLPNMVRVRYKGNEKGFGAHRLDGPACETLDGIKYYLIQDYFYSEKDYWNHPDVIAYAYVKEHPELEAFV